LGSERFRLAGVALGFLAFLAAVVVLIILIWPPASVGVVLIGADYADNPLVPPNILGWKVIEAIESLCKTPARWALFTPARLELLGNVHTIEQRDDWDQVTSELVKGHFKNPTILIVVSLHGGSDSKSGYLIPNRMAQTSDRIELADVIKSMGKLPAEKQKILVLEAAQSTSNWWLGMLHNDFARRLIELEPEIRKIPNLWVYSAASVDERCWSSEGLQRTIFGHYLIEALRGQASRNDSRLTLAALDRYVSSSVKKWVWSARGAIQQPVLLPGAVKSGRGEKAISPARTPSDEQTAVRATPRAAADVFLATVPAPPAAKPREPSDADLRSAWDAFRNLDSLTPHPSTYSPRRWREYRALLVRYDELVRAGASTAVCDPLMERIVASRANIERGRFLGQTLASVENNLAMRCLEGASGDPETSNEEFSAFWNQSLVSEADKIWKLLQGADTASSPERASARVRADDFLLSRAIVDPSQNLERVAERLEITRGHDYPQPAEAHFVRMLTGRLKPVANQPAKRLDLIRRAITLRLLAERCALAASSVSHEHSPVTSSVPREYSYSEQVHPWINQQLEAADGLRRQGEDLLFSSEPSAWDQAVAALSHAGQLFDEISNRSATIQKALAARDRAFSELPFFSHWVAVHPVVPVQAELLPWIEHLWKTAHGLATALESTDRTGDLNVVRQEASALSEGRSQLSNRFAELAEQMEEVRTKDDAQASTAAAGVPLGGPRGTAARETLWQRLANLRKHDIELAAAPESQTLELTDLDKADIQKQVRARAEAQGRLALAALGTRWFDNSAVFSDHEETAYDSTLKRVQSAGDLESHRTETWWQDIAVAGDAIAQRYQRLAPQIERLSDEQHGIPDFRAFHDRLVQADRLQRQIDAASPRVDDSDFEAASRLRQARVHNMLIALAERAWQDHWYDEDPKERYYLAVGSKYLADAERFFPGTAPVRAAQEGLHRPGKLVASGPTRRLLTSEAGCGLVYKVGREGAVPDGLPVVKATALPPLALDEAASSFHALSGGQDPHTVRVAVGNPLGNRFEKDPSENKPRTANSSIKLEGYFRGQIFGTTTEVPIHPVPDTVAIGPPPADPPDASIAVRASKEIIARFGAGTGTIAIVLDCSGSMLDPTVPGRTKFGDAQRALEEVLDLVPPQTKLSLWTFSQIPPGVQVHVEDPIAINPELTVKALRPLAPWHPQQTKPLVKQIAELHPFLDTPLIWAMWVVADQDLKFAKGLKTLLVLTDGDDTEFDKNKPWYKLPKPPDNDFNAVKDFFVERLKPLGITVNMAFFTPQANIQQIKRARDRFTQALAQLEPRGSFKEAKDLPELIATLRRGLVQKLTCQVLGSDGKPALEEPLEVTDPQALEQWSRGLKPGFYKLRVNVGEFVEKDIELGSGDRIIVELVENQAGAVSFRRCLYSSSIEHKDRPSIDPADWRLTSLANQVRRQGDNDALRIVAALEAKPQVGEDQQVRQITPSLAWFRLGAVDVRNPESLFMTRWRERVFFPGPVWQFDVPRWISGRAGERFAEPVLKAFWADPAAKLDVAADVRFNAPDDSGELPRAVPLNVTVESISLEDHRVEVAPDEPMQTKPCLVVRLEYPDDSPCVVDPASLAGLDIIGYEHRIYSQADKYTGLFWPVSQASFKRLAHFSLISLRKFQAAAEGAHTLELRLKPPRVDELIPTPPKILLQNR
jgi:hypothetical protein